MIDEQDLTEKLLTTFHLNAIERKTLPNGKVKLSFIKKIIKEKLNASDWFPANWRPETPYTGGLIEICSNKEYKIYHKEEVSFMNYVIVEIINLSNFDKTVEKFIKLTFKDNIDGIPIDYKA